MQITRDERLAKLQGFSMLAIMALVAVTVHFWPRQSAVVMTSRPAVAAPSTAATERHPASLAPRPVSPPRRRQVPLPLAAVEPASPELPRVSAPLSGPAIASLPALPGTSIAMSPAPSLLDLDLSGRKNQELTPTGGAVTRAMQTTGRSLAGAFKKTASAFRRAF